MHENDGALEIFQTGCVLIFLFLFPRFKKKKKFEYEPKNEGRYDKIANHATFKNKKKRVTADDYSNSIFCFVFVFFQPTTQFP